MLYTTTRSDHDTFTPERALKERSAPDGGLYVPMRPTAFSQEELSALMGQATPAIIAEVMNRFFSTKLTQRDVEFCMGKSFFKLASFSHRITVAECWHNPEGNFSRILKILAKRVAVDKSSVPVGEWMQVAGRVAMLLCIYAQMLQQGIISPQTGFDVAVGCGDFEGPMAAWYARQMGLPIDNIVCCCNDNGAAWDLLQQGQMKTSAPVIKTSTPRYDVAIPAGLERLIRVSIGLEEAQRYAAACEFGSRYDLSAEQHRLLRQGMYASVISGKRLPGVIANVYATNGYVLCPYSGLIYSGLMDYRAATGNNGPALLISETSPVQCEDAIADAMGITVPQLHNRLDLV